MNGRGGRGGGGQHGAGLLRRSDGRVFDGTFDSDCLLAGRYTDEAGVVWAIEAAPSTTMARLVDLGDRALTVKRPASESPARAGTPEGRRPRGFESLSLGPRGSP